jgi:beta-phosphoglucomutase-like phosphatase (HAD superfamily)
VLGAVLFDMDGLLVDTEPLWTIAEHELAARLGGEFTPEMKAAMIGMGIDTAVPVLLEMLGRPDVDPWAAGELMVGRVAELFGEPGAVVNQPGAEELLNSIAEAGIPAALVSSSFRVLMDPVLGVLGHHRFAVTVAGDEVTRRKPDPDPYLRAASLLQVPPARCVVLEDSTSGAQAGLAAGCPVVFVPSMPAMPPVPAATTVGSLHDVTLDLLDALAAAAADTAAADTAAAPPTATPTPPPFPSPYLPLP